MRAPKKAKDTTDTAAAPADPVSSSSTADGSVPETPATTAEAHAEQQLNQQVEGAMRPDLASRLQKSGVDKESAIYRAAVRIQSRFRGYAVRKVT